MSLVSVIVPCYNEELTIDLLLRAVKDQTYPACDIEVIIADGRSSDRSREIVALFQKTNPQPRIKIVDNPRRIIPAALNCALASAEGDYIIRLDAHSAPAEDYIERCVSALEAGLGDNVGGLWNIRPANPTYIAEAIAIAASHPVGAGDARYRYSSQPGYVDTVPFGAFKRDVFDRIGLYNEDLLTNEDYEFNTRLRKDGGKIWFDPAIHSVYYARPNLVSLARQYWRYGFWKFKMLKSYPGTLRIRQALPPVLVASLIALGPLSFIHRYFAWLFAAEVIMYILFVWMGTCPGVLKRYLIKYWLGVVMSIVTMHFAWGAGFLWSAFTLILGFLRGKRV